MKNLSKTVDRILKIEPSLEALLIPIKIKWDKGPRKMIYWKQLFKILNSEIPKTHPKRFEIQNIFSVKKSSVKKKLYTFEFPSLNETVIGTIPEHLEGIIRRNDRMKIKHAKQILEAKLTHNDVLMVEANKQSEKLEIEEKKIWFNIKNYFNIWKVNVPTSFFIREKEGLLVLTAIDYPSGPIMGSPDTPDSFVIRMNNDIFKKFLKYLNDFPPFPGFQPPTLPESDQ